MSAVSPIATLVAELRAYANNRALQAAVPTDLLNSAADVIVAQQRELERLQGERVTVRPRVAPIVLGEPGTGRAGRLASWLRTLLRGEAPTRPAIATTAEDDTDADTDPGDPPEAA